MGRLPKEIADKIKDMHIQDAEWFKPEMSAWDALSNIMADAGITFNIDRQTKRSMQKVKWYDALER